MSKSIFMIAGEPSGDVLGGHLIKALKAKAPDTDITGIGGLHMKAEGLDSLLPMDELCVMGLWEVLGQLPRLLKLINGVVEEVEKRQPDILVTIDLPDFNFRVAQRLKKRGKFKGKIVHYVAPTVWAWRPGRAKAISKFLDGLICLFPFEPEYFEPHGLNAIAAGHPMVEDNSIVDAKTGEQFRKAREIAEDATVLAVYCGSREAELEMIKPVYKEVFRYLKGQFENLVLIFPSVPAIEYNVREFSSHFRYPSLVITDEEYKRQALSAYDGAVAVSGTAGLELAYAGVPHLIAYKVHPVSWLLLKLLVKTKFAHLGNILMGRKIVPEFLQMDCTGQKIARGVLQILKKEDVRSQQMRDFKELQSLMGADKEKLPSEKAAEFVLDVIRLSS